MLLVAVVASLYANTLFHGFVFDDVTLIQQNPDVIDLNWGKILGRSGYRPIRTFTYALNSALGGMNPFGYHLFNVLLHAANSLLVFLFLRSIQGRIDVSFLGAMLFAVHPVQTASVAYISGRKDLLAAFFVLLALLPYNKWRRQGGWQGLTLTGSALLLAILSKEVAAVFPVIVEKGFVLDESDGGGGWAGHYLLLTGYDDAEQTFTVQDTNPGTGGPDRSISYQEMDEGWREFNRVYMYIYLPQDEARIQSILGQHADLDTNRSSALAAAQSEIESDPQDPYGWFNLGTNLVYFERYGEAAQAFDNALSLGLPWRFTRYQFGPYIAYFNQGRFQDVIDLAEATLFRTYKAEESLLWRGWANFRLGDLNSAVVDWREALEYNPNYQDAKYALDYVGSTP